MTLLRGGIYGEFYAFPMPHQVVFIACYTSTYILHYCLGHMYSHIFSTILKQCDVKGPLYSNEICKK